MNINRIDLTPLVLLILIILVVFILFGALVDDRGLLNMDASGNQTGMQTTLQDGSMLNGANMQEQATAESPNMQATQAAVAEMQSQIQTTQTAVVGLQTQVQATQTAMADIQAQVQATQIAIETMQTEVQATQVAVGNMKEQVIWDAQQVRATQTAWEDARNEAERMREENKKDAIAFAEAALYYTLPFVIIAAVIIVAMMLNAVVKIKRKEAEAQHINAHRKLREYREKQRELAAAAEARRSTTQSQFNKPPREKQNAYIWPVKDEAHPEVGHEVR